MSSLPHPSYVESANAVPETREWAENAARLMIEEGFIDYRLAKQKAAKQLGFAEAHQPNNALVEQLALAYYHFYREYPEVCWHISQLQFAHDSLKALAAYRPRLSGTLTLGRPNPLDEIEIHIQRVLPELVYDDLLARGLKVHIREKQFHMNNGARYVAPVYAVNLGEFCALITCFDESQHHFSPLSPAHNGVMARWDQSKIAQEMKMLEQVLDSL